MLELKTRSKDVKAFIKKHADKGHNRVYSALHGMISERIENKAGDMGLHHDENIRKEVAEHHAKKLMTRHFKKG